MCSSSQKSQEIAGIIRKGPENRTEPHCCAHGLSTECTSDFCVSRGDGGGEKGSEEGNLKGNEDETSAF